MKKSFYLVFTSFLFFSCTETELYESLGNESKNEVIEQNEKESSVMEFTNKEAFLDAIENGVAPQTRALAESDFISLMDEISPNDPILDSLTCEEKDYVLNNHLTYYEAFDCEGIVPNENFARTLNLDGEVVVNDTIYKVTGYGTLYAKAIYRKELESAFEKVNEKDLQFRNNEEEKQLSTNVKMVNTFAKKQLADNPYYQRYTDNDDGVINGNTTGRGTQPSSSSSSTSTSPSNTPIEQIPFSSFATYPSGSKTFVGKLWQALWGERSTKRHEFKKGYRVNGSMYDYDYKVYHECGVLVSMSKKRGGFFKKINGWKDVKADELVMNLNDFVLSMSVNISNPVKQQMPKTTQVVGYNNQFNIIGNNIKAVNILGYDISEKTIQQILGRGLKAGLEYLRKITNKNIDNDTKVAQIITPKKIYIIVLSDPIYAHNTKKLRKVFGAGANFVISSSVINAPLSIKSYTELLGLFNQLPRKHIDCGTVNLAGRIGSDWGGMNIYKD